jgi:hypothetical protein
VPFHQEDRLIRARGFVDDEARILDRRNCAHPNQGLILDDENGFAYRLRAAHQGKTRREPNSSEVASHAYSLLRRLESGFHWRWAVAFFDTSVSDFFSHLACRLVRPKLDEDSVAQQSVAGPDQINDFGNELRLDPVNARQYER